MMRTLSAGRVRSLVGPLVYLCLFVVFLFSIRELSRHGAVQDYLFLFFGPPVSAVGVFFAGRTGAAAWVPGFFGLYLVGYRGFWRLSELSAGFSWVILFKAGCFIIVGLVIAAGVFSLSEEGREPEKGWGEKESD